MKAIIVSFLEIVILFISFYFLSFLWNFRSMDLLVGILVSVVIFIFLFLVDFPVLSQLVIYISGVSVMALLIVFQPELRLALSRMSFKRKRYHDIDEFDKFLDQLANSIYRLADKKIGALVALEKGDSLNSFIIKACVINANFSSELLESIFAINTPLHDGAVIIRGQTILFASAILPLAEESSRFSKSLGTRHRAALGATQVTDALVIVVSEENGKISISRDGIMTKGIKVDRFKGIIRSVFSPLLGKKL